MKTKTERIELPGETNFHISEPIQSRIVDPLAQLLDSAGSGDEDTGLVDRNGFSESCFLFGEIKSVETRLKSPRRELINLYPIDSNKYLVKIAFKDGSNLGAIVSFIASAKNEAMVFSSPLKYRTRSWKKKTISSVRYYYQDSLNEKIAESFVRKNEEIAEKFGLAAKKLNYFKCSNYDEVQWVLGIDYDAKSAGTVQSSESFDNTIITGLNTENFEHDVFHMYIESEFPSGEDRNFIAEEGYANSIADAYYAKINGDVITRNELTGCLREYLAENSEADLLQLFQKDPRVFHPLSEEVSQEVFDLLSVRSTITSLFCDEVERLNGFEGIIKLLRCGEGEDAYFKALDDLIGVNKTNFDKTAKELVARKN
ncbi:MAG: hypothetical protein HKN25_16140 [Pyrinomonadaceae bacterium]|nr:hypothetical protein [Pyrinomonadaceae bacterium]